MGHCLADVFDWECFINDITDGKEKDLLVVDFLNISHRLVNKNPYNDPKRCVNFLLKTKPNRHLILVHKNREGMSVDLQYINTLLYLTYIHDNVSIVFCLSGSAKKIHPHETPRDVKNRYKRTNKKIYYEYSRDDCVLYSIVGCLKHKSITTEVLTKDRYLDNQIYKYLAPFPVFIINKGLLLIHMFDYNQVRIG